MTPPSRSATGTRRCTAHACSRVTASNCRRRPICICSCPGVKPRSRAQGRYTKAMRCGSPHPAASASPPRNPPRSWSGRCMRVWLRRKRIGPALAGVVLAAACSTNSTSSTPLAPTADAPAGLVPATVQVDPDLAQPPFDEPRQALVPAGWTLSVWARVPEARLAAWAPDRTLLVSVPSGGQVVRVQPSGARPRLSVPLDGLDQPHGLAVSGSTLYVAESDQIDAYDYADGAATNRRTVAAGLPDAKSPDLRGAYAHALKSVTVGPDGALYFSIGSTSNISAADRVADPPR